MTSPVTTIREPKPSRVRNIFICSARRVLGLVEDDERVVEGPAAHVGQRRDLDDPGGHQPGHRLRLDHVAQGVVQRAHVGVDLLRTACPAGTRAARRPRPPGRVRMIRETSLAMQRLDRLRHGQVGLAGAGRPDPKGRACARRSRRRTASGSGSWPGSSLPRARRRTLRVSTADGAARSTVGPVIIFELRRHGIHREALAGLRINRSTKLRRRAARPWPPVGGGSPATVTSLPRSVRSGLSNEVSMTRSRELARGRRARLTVGTAGGDDEGHAATREASAARSRSGRVTGWAFWHGSTSWGLGTCTGTGGWDDGAGVFDCSDH